jgi:hypothetical protein
MLIKESKEKANKLKRRNPMLYKHHGESIKDFVKMNKYFTLNIKRKLYQGATAPLKPNQNFYFESSTSAHCGL